MRNWIANYSLPLAEVYEASVRLMYEVPLSGRVVLVCHAVREIRNRLPEAVSGIWGAGRLDYKSRVDRLADAWRATGLGDPTLARSGSGAVATAPQMPIDRGLYLEFAGLLADHSSARERPQDAAARLFAGAAPGAPGRLDGLRPAIVQWVSVTGWFMQRAHVGQRTDADHDAEELRRNFDLFEMTLAALAQSFYETVDDIDAILEETNR